MIHGPGIFKFVLRIDEPIEKGLISGICFPATYLYYDVFIEVKSLTFFCVEIKKKIFSNENE